MFSVKTRRKVWFTNLYVQVRGFTVCMKSDFLSYYVFLLFPKLQAEEERKIDFGLQQLLYQSLPAGHTCQCALACFLGVWSTVHCSRVSSLSVSNSKREIQYLNFKQNPTMLYLQVPQSACSLSQPPGTSITICPITVFTAGLPRYTVLPLLPGKRKKSLLLQAKS